MNNRRILLPKKRLIGYVKTNDDAMNSFVLKVPFRRIFLVLVNMFRFWLKIVRPCETDTLIYPRAAPLNVAKLCMTVWLIAS